MPTYAYMQIHMHTYTSTKMHACMCGCVCVYLTYTEAFKKQLLVSFHCESSHGIDIE